MESNMKDQVVYTIEKGDLKDFPEIVDVWEASVRATHHFLSEEDILYFKPLILHEYLDAVELWLALDEQQKIVGFLGIQESSIEMLFIHPEHRGKGAGKLLLNYAIQEHRTKFVDVNEQNTQAVGFYEKMGFVTRSRSERDSMGKPYPILHMEFIRNNAE